MTDPRLPRFFSLLASRTRINFDPVYVGILLTTLLLSVSPPGHAENVTPNVVEHKVDRADTSGHKTHKLVFDHALFDNHIVDSLARESFVQQTRASLPAKAPDIELMWAALRDRSRDGILDFGETATLVVCVRNKGGATVHGLQIATTDSEREEKLFSHNASFLGDVDPGIEVLGEIEIQLLEKVQESDRQIKVIAFAKEGVESQPIEIALRVHTSLPRHLTTRLSIHFEPKNFGGTIDRKSEIGFLGEFLYFRVYLTNLGDNFAKNIQFKMSLGEDVIVDLEGNDVFKFRDIEPNGEEFKEFSIRTGKELKMLQRIPIAIEINAGENYDAVYQRDELLLTGELPYWLLGRFLGPEKKGEDRKQRAELVSIHKDFGFPTALKRRPNAIAVVIGNKNYRHNLPGVDYAIQDAIAVKKYLLHALGFSHNNIIYVEDATAAKFTEIFGTPENPAGKLFNYVERGVSEVFIYYSGHGAPGPNGYDAYFVPVDTNPNLIALSGYSLSTFYSNLARVGAKQITVVLDTCFSGNSNGGAITSNAPASMPRLQERLPPRAAVFTSASEGQVSSWWPEKRHSLFTYWFLNGLSGPADRNRDGLITTSEMRDYVMAPVARLARKLSGVIQTPKLHKNTDIELIQYVTTTQTRPLLFPNLLLPPLNPR